MAALGIEIMFHIAKRAGHLLNELMKKKQWLLSINMIYSSLRPIYPGASNLTTWGSIHLEVLREKKRENNSKVKNKKMMVPSETAIWEWTGHLGILYH